VATAGFVAFDRAHLQRDVAAERIAHGEIDRGLLGFADQCANAVAGDEIVRHRIRRVR